MKYDWQKIISMVLSSKRNYQETVESLSSKTSKELISDSQMSPDKEDPNFSTQLSTPSSLSSLSMSLEQQSESSNKSEKIRDTGEMSVCEGCKSPSYQSSTAEMLVVSIGDGQHERQASHCIANELDVGCVSIKLIEAPSPDVLARELVLVKDHLPKIVGHYWERYDQYTFGFNNHQDVPQHSRKVVFTTENRRELRFNSNLDLQINISTGPDKVANLLISNYVSEAETSEGEDIESCTKQAPSKEKMDIENGSHNHTEDAVVSVDQSQDSAVRRVTWMRSVKCTPYAPSSCP